MRVVSEIGEMRRCSLEVTRGGGMVVLVPTMGSLHRGHMALVERAREEAGDGGLVVLSIFVNPAQFGEGEDYSSYPRPIEEDLKMAEEAGVDIVFTPRPEDVYPDGFATYVTVEGPLVDRLCGASRPGHFRGVATVVAKLFSMVGPGKAVFGLKDFQQLLVIRRLTRDLDLPVEIIGVETVREADGLAVSSRNAYLNKSQREAAARIPASLEAAERLLRGGERDPAKLREAVKKTVEAGGGAVVEYPVVEYIEIRDPVTLEEVDRVEGSALLAVAVRIGNARLIDNRIIEG